jgi:hypothetical protein
MAAAAVITLSTAPALAQSSSTPSLGEVARQTEKQRAASKPAVMVYTNADLAPKPDEVAPATPSADAPTTGGYVSKSTGEVLSAEEMHAASQETLSRNNAKRDEKWWRAEATRLRNELEKMRDTVDGYRTAAPRTAAMKQIAAKELAKVEAALAGIEKRWAAFEESARDAQVPHAWLEPQ